MAIQGAAPKFTTEASNSSISSFLKSLRESVTDFSATGRAIVEARTNVRSALADGRNVDAINAQIAMLASGSPAAESLRAQRDALLAADQSGTDGNPFTSGRAGGMLLILGVAVAAYFLAKR